MCIPGTNADYIREILDFPGCPIGLRVDRELRADDGKIVLHDTRYYVCSLAPEKVTAADLLPYVRQHWRTLRWWDEDRQHTRRPELSACMAAINNAALSIHRLKSDPGIPVQAAADYIAWGPAVEMQLLT